MKDDRALRLQYALEVAAGRVLLNATRILPTRSFMALAAAVGRFAGRHVPKARDRALENLALVWPDMPEAERREIAAQSGATLCLWGVEYIRSAALAADPSLLEVEGAEHVTAALEAGRPIVFVTAHFGSWEFIRYAARGLGAETGILYRAFNNPRFDEYAQGFIRPGGEPVMHKGRQGSRRLLRHIARKGAAMILVDQRQTGAPLIPFLGRPAETALSAAELALRFDAALIPARALRVEAGRKYHVRFEAPVEAADAAGAMEQVNARIGAWVTEAPGQWFWMHRRWRLSDGVEVDGAD